jgi:predicted dehydrogenase
MAPAPKELNWEMWLGQAPLVDFRVLNTEKPPEGFWQKYYSRGHYEFRWWYEYSGGKMTDWGAHHVDVALWALELDNTGPSVVRVESSKFPQPFKNGFPTLDDRYNTATDFHVVAQFGDIAVHITSEGDNGVLFEGDKGRIFVNREKLTGKPAEELTVELPAEKGPDGKEQPPKHEIQVPEQQLMAAYKGQKPTGHMANFIDCVKSRAQPISDVWSHHRSISTCHLANIALRLDREVKWDPAKEQVIGDDEAQSFVSRAQRKGYEIVV